MKTMGLETAQKYFNYEPESGALTWKVSTGARAEGQLAGTVVESGHIVLSLMGERYYGHHVAYLLATGKWADKVSFKNHDPSDLSAENLFKNTNPRNRNQRMLSNNTSGYTGLSHTKSGKWIARIRVESKLINLGTFEKCGDAVLARMEAEKRYGFSESHGK